MTVEIHVGHSLVGGLRIFWTGSEEQKDKKQEDMRQEVRGMQREQNRYAVQ
jgi:hypothetical protein